MRLLTTLLLFAASAFGVTQTWNTPGSTTFTVPSGVTAIQAKCWGAGGGGGGGFCESQRCGGGGGGGGGSYNTSTGDFRQSGQQGNQGETCDWGDGCGGWGGSGGGSNNQGSGFNPACAAPGGGCQGGNGESGGNAGIAGRVEITYTVNNTPQTIGLSGIPANVAYNTWFYVSATVRDADGYGNINYMHILINNGVDANQACYFLMYPNGNYFHLSGDGGGWQGAITMGTGNYPQNITCQVDTPSSYFSKSGTDVTAVVRIMFKPFQLSRPPLHGYVYVVDNGGLAAGWTYYQTGYLRSRPQVTNY
jgi:hypothetical protein